MKNAATIERMAERSRAIAKRLVNAVPVAPAPKKHISVSCCTVSMGRSSTYRSHGAHR